MGKELKGRSEGYKVKVEKEFGEVEADDFNALLIPGDYSPDKLRAHKEVLDFVKKLRINQ